MSHANKQENMAHTQRGKKVVNRHCPWRSPDVGFTRQRL